MDHKKGWPWRNWLLLWVLCGLGGYLTWPCIKALIRELSR